jgi:hypothetical protein
LEITIRPPITTLFKEKSPPSDASLNAHVPGWSRSFTGKKINKNYYQNVIVILLTLFHFELVLILIYTRIKGKIF